METRKAAASKLESLTQVLENASHGEKEKLLLQILNEFPYLHGYWNQLLRLTNYDQQNIKRALEECPSLEMFKIALKTNFVASPDAPYQTLSRIGYHYRAGTLWAEIFEKRPDALKILPEIVDFPLYDYARLYQIAFETKSVSSDSLSHKASVVSAEVNNLWQFECKLKRDYFHVFDIDETELVTWVKYLKYTESLGNSSRTWQLYQRCLIVTALYPEFWIMWIRWIELNQKIGIPENGLSTVVSSALHYHRHDPEIRLIASRYLESENKIDEAGELLKENIVELLQFQKRHQVNISQYLGQDSLCFGDILESQPLNPSELFHLYEEGKCADPAIYAEKLRDAGCRDEFFIVDSRLEY